MSENGDVFIFAYRDGIWTLWKIVYKLLEIGVSFQLIRHLSQEYCLLF